MAAPSRSSSPHVLITGARGRLATCIRPHLENAGLPVTALSRTAGPDCLALDDFFTEPLTDHADALLHLAWSTLPASSERAIGTEWSHDLPLLFRILQQLVNSPRRERIHFIFFSSGGAVYGQGHGEGRPSREEDPCRPIGWYAQAKLAAEEIVQAFADRHGLPCTILRISNPYGFSIPPDRAQGIIPHAFACAHSGRPLSLWGDGSARKDFLHVSDFNRALQLVIERRLTGTYNLAAGISTRVIDVIAGIEAITGRPVPLERQPARPWDVQTSLLDNRKLRADAGWAPQISLTDGLRLTAQELSY